MLTGLHILPNSISMSLGSVFAGQVVDLVFVIKRPKSYIKHSSADLAYLYRWMMHKTGKYKMINVTFGIFPFIATILLILLKEDSPAVQQWFSIVSELNSTPHYITRNRRILSYWPICLDTAGVRQCGCASSKRFLLSCSIVCCESSCQVTS